jgi:hypothetical protein
MNGPVNVNYDTKTCSLWTKERSDEIRQGSGINYAAERVNSRRDLISALSADRLPD